MKANIDFRFYWKIYYKCRAEGEFLLSILGTNSFSLTGDISPKERPVDVF